MTLADLATRASGEIRDAVAAIAPSGMEELTGALASARRIACHGVGREGLMMRALAMRLYHLGLDAHVVGDMSCPPVGPGDLLLVSARVSECRAATLTDRRRTGCGRARGLRDGPASGPGAAGGRHDPAHSGADDGG